MNSNSTKCPVGMQKNSVPSESCARITTGMSADSALIENTDSQPSGELCDPEFSGRMDPKPASGSERTDIDGNTSLHSGTENLRTAIPGSSTEEEFFQEVGDGDQLLQQHRDVASMDTSETSIDATCHTGTRRGSKVKRVSFAEAPDEVREFTKPENEIAAEKLHLEQLKAMQEESFAEMKQRWANKSKTFLKIPPVADAEPANNGDTRTGLPPPMPRAGPQLATSADVDFREIRVISLNRGKQMAPLGVDLLIKPAVAPETGTVVLVKDIKRGKDAGVVAAGKGNATLRKGDRILKVWDSDLSNVEPGQFLSMLSNSSIEMHVYNTGDEATKRRECEAAAQQAVVLREQDLVDRQLREQNLLVAEKQLMIDWVEHFEGKLRHTNPSTETSTSLIRTVFIDRRTTTAGEKTLTEYRTRGNDRSEVRVCDGWWEREDGGCYVTVSGFYVVLLFCCTCLYLSCSSGTMILHNIPLYSCDWYAVDYILL
eukprot:m.1117995 g.1117995  ORF g.1117995 m.1117995 type:complete len:486 (-) comp24381_c1_seq22:1665-3122(-)